MHELWCQEGHRANVDARIDMNDFHSFNSDVTFAFAVKLLGQFGCAVEPDHPFTTPRAGPGKG